jgi:hypothetical protein
MRARELREGRRSRGEALHPGIAGVGLVLPEKAPGIAVLIEVLEQGIDGLGILHGAG